MEGKKLFIKELNYLKDKSFPKDVVMYFYDDGNIKNAVTDIVSHWQSNLSAFVNIKSVSSAEVLIPQLKEKTLKLAKDIVAFEEDTVERMKKFL